jgi:hypothetical protein
MPKNNKFLYGHKLYVNYGQGWEYEIFEEDFKGFRENAKAYRENCIYPQKWTHGREPNPAYIKHLGAIKSILTHEKGE